MAVPVLAYVFPVYVLGVLWRKDMLFLLLNSVVCRYVLQQVKLYTWLHLISVAIMKLGTD
jgi:hypothetical protein